MAALAAMVTYHSKRGGRTKRYDACWWVATRKKSKTFTKKKAAENSLTAMVKRVPAGTYVEVVPAFS